MLGAKSLLLSLLSVGTLGSLATGGYFLFRPETSENVDTSKNSTENSTPNERQNNLNESQTQNQSLSAESTSDSDRGDVSDPDQTQSLASISTAAPSQSAGGAHDVGVQLPSR